MTLESLGGLVETGNYAGLIDAVGALSKEQQSAYISTTEGSFLVGLSLVRCGLPHACKQLIRLRQKKTGDDEAVLKLTVILTGSRPGRSSYPVIVKATNDLMRMDPQSVLGDDLFFANLGTLGLFPEFAPWADHIPSPQLQKVVENCACGDPEEIRHAIEQAWPQIDSTALLVAFGVLLSDMNADEKALKPLSKALTIAPGHPDALATRLYVLDRLNRAEEDLDYPKLDAIAIKHEYFWRVYNAVMGKVDKSRQRKAALERWKFLKSMDSQATSILRSFRDN